MGEGGVGGGGGGEKKKRTPQSKVYYFKVPRKAFFPCLSAVARVVCYVWLCVCLYVREKESEETTERFLLKLAFFFLPEFIYK